MNKKSRNINWVIELGLLIAYVVLYIIHLYSFDESYHSNVNWLLRLCFKIFTVYYLFFGFAIFNGISIHNLIKREVYSSLSKIKVFKGFLMGLVMAIYCLYPSEFWDNSELLMISLFFITSGFYFSIGCTLL